MSGYAEKYTIKGSQTDMWGNLKCSALLEMFQDAADVHTSMNGMSNGEMQAKWGASWVVARIWLKLHRPIHRGETITVATFQRPLRGIQFVRDTDILDESGKLIGTGISTWILVNSGTHSFLGTESVKKIVDGCESIYDSDKTEKPPRLHMPEVLMPVYEKTFMYSSIDGNGHVNNACYPDMACDACRLEEEKNKFVSELLLGYKVECRAGETVTLFSAEQDKYRFVQGRVKDGLRFEARITIEDI